MAPALARACAMFHILRMSITRDKLYEEVWAEPMTKVAARFKVSSNYLARVPAKCLSGRRATVCRVPRRPPRPLPATTGRR